MGKVIKKTMIVIIMVASLALSIFAGLNISWITNVLKDITDKRINNESLKFTNQISMIFENAEGAVDALCSNTEITFDVEKQQGDMDYINDYMNEYSAVYKNALSDIEDAIGIYLTFNPKLTDRQGVYEIWYAYDENREIRTMDAMNNGVYQEAFDDKSAPNMQYYFDAAANTSTGIWTEPSMDPDMKEMTISYSKSAYANDELIGVVGTDISTAHTTEVINDLDIGDEGAVILLNEDKDIIVSSHGIKSFGIRDSEKFKYIFREYITGSNGIFSTKLGGEDLRVSFGTLSNDWTLALIRTENELYMPVEYAASFIIVLCVVLAIFSIFAMYLLLRKVSDPMNKAVRILKATALDEYIATADTANLTNEDDLEYLVQKAVERQRLSDIMLANQSKLASVGEMMSNVTHQWKQPLNSINIIMGSLEDDIKYGELNEQKVRRAVGKVESLARTMTNTINDFTSYLKPDTTVEEFKVNDVITGALGIVEEKMKFEKINAEFRPEAEYIAFGYKNALFHVILNVLTNAIEAISGTSSKVSDTADTDIQQIGSPKERLIRISVTDDNSSVQKLTIRIYNNGPHISQDIFSAMFKPYNSTKADGSGLGLFISKTLIEESMDGIIEINNIDDGVLCSIQINGAPSQRDGNEQHSAE